MLSPKAKAQLPQTIHVKNESADRIACLRMLLYNSIGDKVDQYVIMPNHIHVILLLEETAEDCRHVTLSNIICAYKSLTTRACKKAHTIDKLFQSSFYEHVIRGREDYHEIAEYILNNPKQWEMDKLYIRE